MPTALGAVVAYLLLQVLVGAWISRRIASESDYLVAGRTLGYPLATFSIFATWFGAESMVGSAGRAYGDGVTLASAEPFGYGLCLLLMGFVFAVPLRSRGLTTLADLYRARYSPTVERVAAVLLVPSSVLWAAAQVRAFGHVLSSTTSSLDVDAALAVAAGLTILYTVFGGMLADAINDLVQGIVLIVGLGVLLWAVVHALGGFDQTVAAVEEVRRTRPPVPAPPLLDLLEEWAIPVLGSVLATELVGRVLSARTPTVARRAPVAAGMLYVLVGLVPLAIGLVGPRLAPGLADGEQLLPTVARTLLPTLPYALFAGGMVAAILSTVDSTLLTASGLLSHNVLVPVLGLTNERTRVRVARGLVATFGVIAWLLARRSEGVHALVETASAFGSAGALVSACFGLFTRIGGAAAALTSLLGGTVAYVAASLGGAAHPFLLSLGTALGGYCVVALVESFGEPK